MISDILSDAVRAISRYQDSLMYSGLECEIENCKVVMECLRIILDAAPPYVDPESDRHVGELAKALCDLNTQKLIEKRESLLEYVKKVREQKSV